MFNKSCSISSLVNSCSRTAVQQQQMVNMFNSAMGLIESRVRNPLTIISPRPISSATHTRPQDGTKKKKKKKKKSQTDPTLGFQLELPARVVQSITRARTDSTASFELPIADGWDTVETLQWTYAVVYEQQSFKFSRSLQPVHSPGSSL